MQEILTFGVSNDNMIVSFGSKDTEMVWLGERVKRLPNEVQAIGRRKLRMVNNSQNIMDLTVPPANKLEKLKGNLKEYYSIRINDQWRIIFKWINGNAFEVEIIDYQ
jgi:proteic killer suppression protein